MSSQHEICFRIENETLLCLYHLLNKFDSHRQHFIHRKPKRMSKLFLLGYEPSNGRGHEDSTKPLVHTRVGSFRGLRAEDGNYSMFLGITYARVDPKNVFGPSIPCVSKGIFDAFDDSVICLQKEEFSGTIKGTLDCLNLNVYVPNSASTINPLPVMIYIYGGKFKFGFASRYLYGPRFIVRHNVILVTFNYRVGPYGFMCLDTPKIPGNAGLKDQVEALRWIKTNIRSFGGDDSKITIFGNSAGATSVDLHQYYLKEQLYHRVIIQSGVALMPDVMRYPDPRVVFQLAEELNYTAGDLPHALSFLSKQDPHKLVAAFENSGIALKPCVEKYSINAENYATKHPVVINSLKDVDVLIGFNSDESYVKYTNMGKKEFDSTDTISLYLNTIFDFRDEQRRFDKLKNIIKHFYYGNNAKCSENRRPDMNIYEDFLFYHPTLRTIQRYLDSEVKNMYLYMFSYSGKRSFIKSIENVSYTEGGASHADELGYLFDISFMKTWLQAEDMLIVDRMTELWTNFAKYGNPTPRPTKLIPIKWPRVTKDNLPYLEINTELRLGSRPWHERMSFLDLLYETIGHYQRGWTTETNRVTFLRRVN